MFVHVHSTSARCESARAHKSVLKAGLGWAEASAALGGKTLLATCECCRDHAPPGHTSLSLSLCTCVDGNSPPWREQERVALQKGFVDYVIGPYYKLVAAAYPAVAPVFELIKQNRETWNRELSPPCVCVYENVRVCA